MSEQEDFDQIENQQLHTLTLNNQKIFKGQDPRELEIEDLKSKLSEAELRFQAARKRWVEHLVISGTDGLDGFGFSEVEDARAYVDQEISAELLRLQEAERQSRLKQEKK